MAALTSSALRQPATFVGLPLELRRKVYSSMIPEDRIINFPASHQGAGERALLALCNTKRGLREEVQTEMYLTCGARLFVTPDREMTVPAGVHFSKFQSIDIRVQYYEQSESSDWQGMSQLTRLLRSGQPELLPSLTVGFQDDKAVAGWGDPKWTTALDESEDSDDEGSVVFDFGWASDDDPWVEHVQLANRVATLAVTNTPTGLALRTGASHESPIAVGVLDHLLDLPPCKSATVQTLPFLQGRSNNDDSPRYDPRWCLFDEVYMQDMWRALELWLKGKRYGLGLPTTLSEHGESRLAQLAYSTHMDGFYCEQVDTEA